MQYDLSLKMGYTYQIPASNARHMLRLLPLSLPGRQRLVAGSLTISPVPEEQRLFTDFFLHPTTSLLVRKPHEKLEIRMKARVHVESLATTADFSPLLPDLADEIADCWSVDALSPHHFLSASPRLSESTEIADYARQWASSPLTVMQIARAMCSKIYEDFTYDGKATNVDTTPDQAFKLKRGVCQDFSHIMIIALRSLGIPAGYVSGFLRTIPPPGKTRLEGADAMHAWVRAWCGETVGWIELDPTNDIPASTDHIVVAYGRDYSDVAPVIGVLKSYGSQKIDQAVDVIPLG
ncbi:MULTISPECIES: transglutaminase family protein [unclassified Rhizobium]|uniref:transglutaminase family protein n=1 Tax=unclassified Rhizobium TaxID=2613769 RepID=UPI001AD9CAF8|nr:MULTISPECIES: transglutaminase family protein [unclassified Rhizobium]MBO9099755.1 transglutaminase family protein [Rhizobium sp. L58/93]MBO9131702.1 transglutaminase family protein [Rhizobium sp. B209b/85]MBO9169744.1 transglutaminase family protein [Rhizobium sp. L245/93]MBO9185702.1 transglutaminase family protein [Rhizobium sp. E27B/91]QXZ82466.1 transglutaminase family protein [Rhizobium sp. K1/93]